MRKKLVEEAPHLVEEWISEKNDRAINEITAGSGYKAWWECNSCENQWQAKVVLRAKGSNCPKCSGKHGIPLLTEAPHLAKEWMVEKNDRLIEDITAGSQYKAWWKCKTCDNQWQAAVVTRSKGSGCRLCAGSSRKKLPYIIDEHKYLTKEWVTDKNIKSIEGITAGSNYKAWWECNSCNYQWESKVSDRVKGDGCPKCAGKHGIPFLIEAPHLAKEWMVEKNDRLIEDITAGSQYKAWWKCKTCDNQWQAEVARRVRGHGCPKCAGKLSIPLLIEAPHLVKEWMMQKNDRAIEDITAGSGYKAWWECNSCNYQWKAEVYRRVKGGGCPKCAGKHGIPLLAEAPHLVEEWMVEKNNRLIEDITAGSGYKAWWECNSCNNQWEAEVKSRVRGSVCPKCVRRKNKIIKSNVLINPIQ